MNTSLQLYIVLNIESFQKSQVCTPVTKVRDELTKKKRIRVDINVSTQPGYSVIYSKYVCQMDTK